MVQLVVLLRENLLAILTGQGDISEVKILSQSSKGRASIFTEVISLQTQLFIRHLHLIKIKFSYKFLMPPRHMHLIKI